MLLPCDVLLADKGDSDLDVAETGQRELSGEWVVRDGCVEEIESRTSKAATKTERPAEPLGCTESRKG